MFVAEAWVHHPERLARYVRADELHTAFNFDFLLAPWHAEPMRESIDRRAVGARGGRRSAHLGPVQPRHGQRGLALRPSSGRAAVAQAERPLDLPADFVVGRRRARAAALLMLALPGGAYVYQGEELGLAEVEDLPEEVLQDPGWEQLRPDRTRPRRVPGPDAVVRARTPRSASAPRMRQRRRGFPSRWHGATLTAEVQAGDKRSMLELYRRALHLRRAQPALGDGTLRWLEAPDGALAFARDPGLVCIANLAAAPVALPDGAELLISSGPLTGDGRLPRDTAVWFRVRD